MRKTLVLAGGALLALLASQGPTLSHGDVQPQPVDTTGLEPLGSEWREENPYRDNATAIKLGAAGYGQNCARCHGLEVISGGLAPDLRYLEKGKEGDTWYLERVRKGAGTKMPAFDGIISQEAVWAIRAYIESKHEE